jgi:hypothetical protein
VEEMEQAKKSGLVKQYHGIPREEGTPTCEDKNASITKLSTFVLESKRTYLNLTIPDNSTNMQKPPGKEQSYY